MKTEVVDLGENPLDRRLTKHVLDLGEGIAGSSSIKAAYIFGDHALGAIRDRGALEVSFVIDSFQPKLMSYARAIGGKNVFAIAVDSWVFERDVDRGFLGEAIAWGLLFPYFPLVNEGFLQGQEVQLKKRLVIELLESLVQAFPELSYELRMKPEYFLYETMLSRARVFPPAMSTVLDFLKVNRIATVLDGYLEALKELQSEGLVFFEDQYVRMSDDFIKRSSGPKARLVSLSKVIPRALFSSILGIWPRLSNAFPRKMSLRSKRQMTATPDEVLTRRVSDPEKYIYVPTQFGLVSLTNRADIEECARAIVGAKEGESVLVERIGGFLNDVYLAKITVGGEEKKVVVKRFKDWSSFKWFPIALWGLGTKSFAVLSLRRLERECSMNRFLYSKGLAVPRLLHVSPKARLVFMDFVQGESMREIIRRMASLRTASRAKKELRVLRRVGRKLARVHALDVALGDTKPENVVVTRNSEIFFMDLEQASRGGDRVWDVAEFLYFAGHDLPPLVKNRTAELVAETFISGYLGAGGDLEIVRKAARPKYTKVFSVFTLPHVMLAMSNVCRRTQK